MKIKLNHYIKKNKLNNMKYKMLLLLVAVLLISANIELVAQDDKVAGNLFYTEFGGPGVLMSANFDSRFLSHTLRGFGFRLGAGFTVKYFESVTAAGYEEGLVRTVYTFPAGLNYVFGKPNAASSFEVGAGISFLSRKTSLFYYGYEKEGNTIGFLTFMYRVAPVNGGISFRIGFTPIIGTSGDLFPMGAIGFGYAF